MTNDEVTGVVRDYFEGWYDGDVERMERALHDDLVKRGPSLAVTNKERMLELTAQGEGKADGIDRRLQIRVEDVHGDIANVTVESAVYREYVQLARAGDGWKIVNTLWQPA
ncbi:MAG TPA: nuclear transport factor 2 family protein [Gaiellaceae bacterium]|jgi:hypothetical protein|nr:nuclear transport factor 2 family protein [Gaiellaceae bacterium]